MSSACISNKSTITIGLALAPINTPVLIGQVCCEWRVGLGKGLCVSTESLTAGLAVGLTLMSGVAVAGALFLFNRWWNSRWSARYVLMMRMMMVLLLDYTYIILLLYKLTILVLGPFKDMNNKEPLLSLQLQCYSLLDTWKMTCLCSIFVLFCLFVWVVQGHSREHQSCGNRRKLSI